MELRTTGIAGLDKLLHGGVPADGLTLVLGDTGSGKSLVAHQYLWEGIRRNEPSVCVLMETHREALSRSMKDFGWDIANHEGKTLRVIEGFTWSFPDLLAQIEQENREFTLSTLDLDKLMLLITQACDQVGPGGRLVFDGLSDLFILLGDDRKVLRLLRRVEVYTAGVKYGAMVTLDPQTQGEVATRAAMHLADGIIEMRLREGEGHEGLRREIRVRSMPQAHESSWHPLSIGAQGLQVGP
jgi:circadian clock protein KaiC